MAEKRAHTGWAKLPLSPFKGSLSEVVTTRPVSEDLWSELFLLCRDFSVYRDIAFEHKTKAKQTQKIWKQFSAHLEQAKEYYENAKQIKSISASLFYYYSFLNLVKAFLLLVTPTLSATLQNIHHGIQEDKHSLNDFSDFKIKTRKGVFTEFYKKIVNPQIPYAMTFEVKGLLGYCVDITYQVETSKISKRSIYHCKIRLQANSSDKTQWIVLAIPKKVPIDNIKSVFPRFPSIFELIDINDASEGRIRNWARETFDFDGWEFKAYEYWQQSKTFTDADSPTIETYSEMIYGQLRGLFTEETTKSSFDCLLCEPIINRQNQNLYPISEDLAIYALMFFWGSLVRYHPDLLFSLRDSKIGWLADDFVQTSPEKFLRLLRNKIFQQSLRY